MLNSLQCFLLMKTALADTMVDIEYLGGTHTITVLIDMRCGRHFAVAVKMCEQPYITYAQCSAYLFLSLLFFLNYRVGLCEFFISLDFHFASSESTFLCKSHWLSSFSFLSSAHVCAYMYVKIQSSNFNDVKKYRMTRYTS